MSLETNLEQLYIIRSNVSVNVEVVAEEIDTSLK
jgi:hypothetical protein